MKKLLSLVLSVLMLLQHSVLSDRLRCTFSLPSEAHSL